MRLYLMQHGLSRPKEEDPERALTVEGAEEVGRVAAFLASAVPDTDLRIVHSGKLRARQTAELLAAAWPGAVVEDGDGLAPMDDPDVWAERLRGLGGQWALVGHLPHLARLAGLLLAGDAEGAVVSFRNAGVVCLEREKDGRWSLRWAVVPELLPTSKL